MRMEARQKKYAKFQGEKIRKTILKIIFRYHQLPNVVFYTIQQQVNTKPRPIGKTVPH